MSKEQSVIVIPGLGDYKPMGIKMLDITTTHWKNHGLKPIIHPVGWHDGEDEFQPKLERLIGLIDELTDKGDKVSLVGTSAGGSAAINAFIERKDAVHKVVNVCGRLQKGTLTGFRSFESRASSSPAFVESIELCESNLTKLTARDKEKIMTVRAMFGDELVPPDTTIVEGAYNTQVPTPEHILSIAATLSIFSRPVIVFLKGN